MWAGGEQEVAEVGGGGSRQKELGNLWGVTYQEVEAVLDLLEAVDVMCLCYLYSKKGIDAKTRGFHTHLDEAPETP